MSLTNPNTVVTEERLNDFYKGILPYLGGMPEMVANKFSKGDLYSTDEKMIGKWIDNKPLYQKVYSKTITPSSNTWATFEDITSLNSEYIMFFGAYQMSNSLIVLPIPYQDSSNHIWVQRENGGTLYLNSTMGAGTYSVVCVYTKTTDSAISIGDDTDYSTEEKIVGTWISGKPLYQKTISCGALPNKTSKSVAHNISNIDIVTHIEGIAVRPDTHASYPLPKVSDANASQQVNIMADRQNIDIDGRNGDASVFTQSYVTIQYTKTTD